MSFCPFPLHPVSMTTFLWPVCSSLERKYPTGIIFFYQTLYHPLPIWTLNFFQCQNCELSLNHIHYSELPLCCYKVISVNTFVTSVGSSMCNFRSLRWKGLSFCEVKLCYCLALLEHKGHIHEQSLNPDFISRERFGLKARAVSSVRRNNCWAKAKCPNWFTLFYSFLFYFILFYIVVCLWAECSDCSYEKIRSSTSDKSLRGQRSSCSLL